MSVLLEHLEPEQTGLEKLELLVVTGEALKPNLVGRWFGKYPGIRMTNAYGPTEASDDIPLPDGAGSGKSHVACGAFRYRT
ncbi:hypothetical protein P7H15_13060 [Paenibacillus larvae]|nr:hypothetical protein [Paenibacillus larvae]MDT2293581.1 hypothetical protein [Paenibacillus larvae]